MDELSPDQASGRKRPHHLATQQCRAQVGDIVTIDLDMQAENGFVPETLFDCKGRITFVLGWGNYLPGIHQLVHGLGVGDSVVKESVDAGWGARNPDLVITVPLSKLPPSMDTRSFVPGETQISLQGGTVVLVTDVHDDYVVIDANPPLSGSSYLCTLKVIDIAQQKHDTSDSLYSWKNGNDDGKSFRTATFALECFWGAELAFMRVPGVVGTKVGYSQGTTQNPTYEQVCSGETKHRESVLVVFDTRKVSYRALVETALARLQELQDPAGLDSSLRSVVDLTGLFDVEDGDENDQLQYRHGIYYHSRKQLVVARQILGPMIAKYGIELLKADTFYDAEQEHQQYLYKGGQSARKSCKDKILCFG